jgi:hypothetical protein
VGEKRVAITKRLRKAKTDAAAAALRKNGRGRIDRGWL